MTRVTADCYIPPYDGVGPWIAQIEHMEETGLSIRPIYLAYAFINN